MERTTPLHQNRYHEKTGATPRPTAQAFPTWDPSLLANRQRQWDEAKAYADHAAKLDAEAETRRKAEAAERDRQRAERDAQIHAKQRAQLLAPARAAYLAAGFSEADWEAVADDVAADIAREQAVKAGTSAAAPVFGRHAF